MGVTLYRSTDASAPTLTGEVGSLINLLDKVLVDGYGSKPAAGWTKAFSGTNKAAYRIGGSSPQPYFRVQDDGPGPDGAREARLRGYGAMTDVDTGTEEFPTVAQLAAGLICRKSNTLDATAREWTVVADARTFILANRDGSTGGLGNGQLGVYVGEFLSLVAGDPYRFLLMAGLAEGNSTTLYEALGGGENFPTTRSLRRAMRDYTGVTQGATVGVHSGRFGDDTLYGVGNIPYPNPVDGRYVLGRPWVHETGSVLRGRLRGVWHPHHTTGPAEYDTFAGSGDLAGKSFIVLIMQGLSGVYRRVFETSDTWEQN